MDMSTINVKLYNSLRNDLHLSEEEAKNFAQTIDEVISEDRNFATKQDLIELKVELKGEIKSTAYAVGLIQFLAIVAALTAIMSFMLSHYKP